MADGTRRGDGPFHAALLAFAQEEMTGDGELAGVDLHQHVVHHASRVVLGALGIEAGAVRHGAGRDPGDLDHLVGGDDGYR